MKRFLAVAAAVTMIIVAIVIRSGIDGDGGGSGDTTKPSTATIACITELADQCRDLGGTVRIEDAAVTAKAIAAGTAQIDAWITLDPWPAMVDQLAKREVTGKATRVARTDLVIAMVAERADRLAGTCPGGAVNWRCLGDAIGGQWTDVGGQPEWGTLKAGLPAQTSAEGVLLLGEAASGYFGNASFATNDFDDAFLVWKSKVTATPATFTRFIQQFPAAFSAVGTTRRDATAGTGTRPVAVIDPVPAARAVVVIAPVEGHGVPGFANGVKDRLRDAGWATDGLDQPTGLPDAGVLLALSGLTG